jgi:hypothetical protein
MRGGDGNNRTGWTDPRYDRLLRAAGEQADAARRLGLLAAAESLLIADGPVIPIYHYATAELVKPYVRGIWSNALDTHPLKDVWIDHGWRPGARPAGEPAPRAPAPTPPPHATSAPATRATATGAGRP